MGTKSVTESPTIRVLQLSQNASTNMVAAQFISPGHMTVYTSAICSLTMSLIQPAQTRANVSRPSPLCSGRALSAMGADGEDVCRSGPEARLLPLDGVPYRPLADE